MLCAEKGINHMKCWLEPCARCWEELADPQSAKFST